MSDKHMNRMGTEYMQFTNTHRMGANIKQEVDKETLKRAQELEMQRQMAYVDRLMENDKDCKPYDDKILVPTAGRVVVLPYENNPYRIPLHKSQSGLILGDTGMPMTYKSEDTGEIEAAKKGIWCCKVIAVGKECKSVMEGEDVYINFAFAAPLPFGGKGYYTISENNVICSVRYDENV